MVESVRHNPNIGSSAVHDQNKSRGKVMDNNPAPAANNATSVAASVDVSLSIADKVKSLSNEPPVNIQLVNEIRQKVSEGRYPIDLNALSSKMFESIKNG
ncbi:MAG: flagellar biosynthesis anti-sigma factor FlgM [Rhodobacteraceae bacterium]|nr:flagellar biosynthesis anti-sigma factor FlgM [Paracoccaceae bacterium]